MSTADGENTTGVTSRIRHPSLIVKRHSQAGTSTTQILTACTVRFKVSRISSNGGTGQTAALGYDRTTRPRGSSTPKGARAHTAEVPRIAADDGQPCRRFCLLRELFSGRKVGLEVRTRSVKVWATA